MLHATLEQEGFRVGTYPSPGELTAPPTLGVVVTLSESSVAVDVRRSCSAGGCQALEDRVDGARTKTLRLVSLRTGRAAPAPAPVSEIDSRGLSAMELLSETASDARHNPPRPLPPIEVGLTAAADVETSSPVNSFGVRPLPTAVNPDASVPTVGVTEVCRPRLRVDL